VCRNKLSMRRKKKKKNLLRGPPYNKPEEKYGSPEDLVNWSKEKRNKKEAKKLLTIRMVMLEGEPAYSPTLNPIERLWKVLKDMMPVFNKISNEDELQEIIINNLQTFFHNPNLVKSICGISE